MNLDNIRQFKLASGEEVIVEVIEWDNQEDAAIIIKNAFEIHFLSSPTGAMRLCTLRPFMIGQIEEGFSQALNSDVIMAQATPSREVLTNYRETLDEYMKINSPDLEPTDEELDRIEKELNSENVVPFPKIDKSKLH